MVHNTCSNGFDANQQTVIELAKDYKKTGMTQSEAEILVEWAKEYGIRNHGIMMHPERGGYWSHINHINIRNIHIAVF